MPVYFNNNSKLFMPIFTIKLTAQTFPRRPELLQYASFWPNQPRRPMHKILPGIPQPEPARAQPPARPLTLAGSQPKVGPIHGQNRQLNAPPCGRRPAP